MISNLNDILEGDVQNPPRRDIYHPSNPCFLAVQGPLAPKKIYIGGVGLHDAADGDGTMQAALGQGDSRGDLGDTRQMSSGC